MKKCKKELKNSKDQWAEKEREEDALKLELQELQKAITEAQEQIKTCEVAVKGEDYKVLYNLD